MPRDASAEFSLRRLFRAALFGLAIGCAIGGTALVGVGAVRWIAAPACPEGVAACVLERDLARGIGVRQVGIGGALVLLSIGMWLLRGEQVPRGR